MSGPAPSRARWLVTRTVHCPSCHADATLSYALPTDTADDRSVQQFVYLCPNLCSVPQREIAPLLDADS